MDRGTKYMWATSRSYEWVWKSCLFRVNPLAYIVKSRLSRSIPLLPFSSSSMPPGQHCRCAFLASQGRAQLRLLDRRFDGLPPMPCSTRRSNNKQWTLVFPSLKSPCWEWKVSVSIAHVSNISIIWSIVVVNFFSFSWICSSDFAKSVTSLSTFVAGST